jgi:small subunit ribosomal protein S17
MMRENRRTVVGKVASAKMQKTVVVTVHRLELHPKYKKYIRKRTRLYAHD